MFKTFNSVLFLAVLVLPLAGFTIPIHPQEEIHAIDDVVYNDVDAGIELGARGAIGVLQEALEAHHPEWAWGKDLGGE